jgi:hypothetical protein
VAKNNTTFLLKDVKGLTYAAFGKITKDVWTKAEEHVVKIEKENCIERSVIQGRSYPKMKCTQICLNVWWRVTK